MNKDRFSWLYRLLGLALSMVMAAGLLHPAASLAAVRETISRGGGGSGGLEGDPLDGNDHAGGGGGGGGSTEHEHSVIDRDDGGSISFLPALVDGRQILLIPEFQSGTLVFRIVIVNNVSDRSED